MNTTLNTWIANLYKHGAIDLNQRDDLAYRLNEQREDFAAVVAAMDAYIRYMPARYHAKWAALLSKHFPAALA